MHICLSLETDRADDFLKLEKKEESREGSILSRGKQEKSLGQSRAAAVSGVYEAHPAHHPARR